MSMTSVHSDHYAGKSLSHNQPIGLLQSDFTYSNVNHLSHNDDKKSRRAVGKKQKDDQPNAYLKMNKSSIKRDKSNSRSPAPYDRKRLKSLWRDFTNELSPEKKKERDRTRTEFGGSKSKEDHEELNLRTAWHDFTEDLAPIGSEDNHMEDRSLNGTIADQI